MIPKIIHYCWLSDDPIPENLKKCMDSWHKFLPDYEFMLWDRNRFDLDKVLWTKQAFESKKYAFAADYIRLYAVYTYGGIYMDMDVEVVRSFDPLLLKSYILGYERINGIEAGIFGGEKGAVWLKKCLSYYDNRNFIISEGCFDTLPLPDIMFNILNNEREILDIYPNEYFTAKSAMTGVVKATENTFTIHHFAGSWLNEEERYYLWLRGKLHWIPGKYGNYITSFIIKTIFEGFMVAIKLSLNNISLKIWKSK